MTTPDTAPPKPQGGIARRIAAAFVIGLILFGVLWYLIFSAVTAALVASGTSVILVAGSSLSDTFESVFEMIANVILGIFAAIGAFFAAIFSIFN